MLTFGGKGEGWGELGRGPSQGLETAYFSWEGGEGGEGTCVYLVMVDFCLVCFHETVPFF